MEGPQLVSAAAFMVYLIPDIVNWFNRTELSRFPIR